MKIDVCGLKFNVEEVEGNRANVDEMGRCELKRGVITISKEMPQDIKEQTLCHEWVHGVLDNYGLLTESSNEYLVNALAIELYRQGFRPKEC